MLEKLYIVIPCYNEEEMLPITAKALLEKMQTLVDEGKIHPDSKVMFVDDGSKDKTWEIIQKLHSIPFFTGVKLSRNKGHQNALLAGMYTAVNYADIIISMDADLQDDINAIDGFLEKRAQGCEIVYGVRSSREKDTKFKRGTAQGYYKLLSRMGVEITYNHADYRLMSQRALRQLLRYRERNLFLRGIVPTIGYKTDCVYYDRAERFAGESKYPLKKMISFAFDGITSFSVKPVHMVLYFGIVFLIVAFSIFCFVMYSLFRGNAVPGWTSLMLSVWFCSGCILLGLGIVGEYVGKIYVEVKDRPRFNIERVLMHEE